jgi:similar to stage IV sporulation protein
MSLYYKGFRRFFGYSKIKISGNADKLLNELVEKKIYFWGTEIDNDGKIYICGSVFSSREILEVSEKLGYETEILLRKGLPFVFEKYKKRYGIFVGMILFWAILFLSSLTVWEVRIAERSGEDPQKIVELLEECGLSMGTFLPSLNVREVENQFLFNNPEYSFLAVNISGTIANVEIRRAIPREDVDKKGDPCNVIAKKEGTVISVEAYGGSPAVQKGDFVSQGDLLISSFMEGSFGVVRSVSAYGKVIAAVSYEYVVEIPLEYETIVPTGREETKTAIKLLCFNANLFFDSEAPFEKCSIESSEKRMKIGEIMFPVQVEKSVYREERIEKASRTKVVAEQKAYDTYENYKSREIKGKILSEATEGEFDENKKAYVLKCFLTVAEDIGEKQPLEQADVLR